MHPTSTEHKEDENMTVKDLTKVMGTQFIAVTITGTGRVSYSGRADKMNAAHIENCKVIEIVAPKSADEATVIKIR